MRYSGSSPGPKRPPGSVFHNSYTPSRSRGPEARPPSPKNRASAAHLGALHPPGITPATGSHQRGGSSRRSTTPPGVRSSTAPCRDTATVSRSDTTCQPPSLSGSSTARGSGSGAAPGSAYDGNGSAPSQPQNTAPPTATRTRNSERANRTTPPPGSGSAPTTRPGTRARSAPRRGSARASALRRRQDERTERSPRTEPTIFTERTRSRPSMQLSLPSGEADEGSVQLPFTRGRTTCPDTRAWAGNPGAKDDHMASSVKAASRAHPSTCARTHAHPAYPYSQGAAP